MGDLFSGKDMNTKALCSNLKFPFFLIYTIFVKMTEKNDDNKSNLNDCLLCFRHAVCFFFHVESHLVFSLTLCVRNHKFIFSYEKN